MKSYLLNTLLFLGAMAAGAYLNGALISVSGYIIPYPEGVDVTTMPGLAAGMILWEPKHFLFPFLAHASGTLLSAFIVSKWSTLYAYGQAVGVGLIFFAMGALMVWELPSPLWFDVMDLSLAYFPMAALGFWWGAKK